MKFIEKMADKAKNLRGAKVPVIAFLGDSVTQGCFEVYLRNDGGVSPVFDEENAYHQRLAKILRMLYPSVPVTVINAGISGDSAAGGLARLARDILPYSPDLTVVSFGLNDSGGGFEKVADYKKNLTEIFRTLQENGSEVIFLTENMMNTETSCHIHEESLRNLADIFRKRQEEGVLDAYFAAAKEAAAECGVPVCDVYEKWKRMAAAGVDTTDLLSNFLNHPIREMHDIPAYMLADMLFE